MSDQVVRNGETVDGVTASTEAGSPGPTVDGQPDALGATLANEPTPPEAAGESAAVGETIAGPADLGATAFASGAGASPTRRAVPTIPGYEIAGELGRGAMGVVYHARHVLLNRPCALKTILTGAYSDPVTTVRFLAEAEAVARLRHPNVVQIHHIGEADGLPFLELEYLDGGSLDRHLDGTPWPARRAAALVEPLARGVAEAHRLGLVHRDLKPSNVLLSAEDVPKVSDFGLAKAVAADSGLTATGSILGTPSYMAPEQAGGKTREVGPAADVYALGAILYELLTGRPPFRGATVLETLEQVKAAEPVPPSRLVPRLPRDVETITLKCLQKDPDRRYESATALADDLRRYQAGAPILARPVGAVARAWRWCKRDPVTAGLVASIALLLIAVAVGSSTAYVRQSRLRAQAHAEAESNRRLRYASDLHLAAQLWDSDEGTADQVAALLAAQKPAPGQADLREFAWRYQWTLLNRSSVALAWHDGAVPALAFTPDGHLTTLDSAGTLRVWDPARRVVVQSLRSSQPREDVPAAEMAHDVEGVLEFPRRLRVRDVMAAELAHDGRKIAVATHDVVRLTDAATDAELRIWPRPGPARLLAFSPDGRWLAALRHDRTVTVADTTSERETVLGSTTVGGGGLGNERALVVAADGRTVWVANAPRNGDVLALGGPAARVWHTDEFTVWSIAVSPDGRRLASGHFQGQVRLWDAQAPGTSQARWMVHAGRVTALAFAPDGRTLATGGSDAAVAVWDVATGRQQRTFKGHRGAVLALAFSDDGARLASSDARGVARLWDLSGSGPWRRLVADVPPAPTFYLAYSPDGRWLASVTSRPLEGSRPPDVLQGAPGDPLGSRRPVTDWMGEVRLWDARTGKLVHRFTADPSYVYRVAFAPDSRTLATGGRDSMVKIWDVATGQLVQSLPGRPSAHLNYFHDGVGALAFSHDGTRLAAGFGRPGLLDPGYDQIVKVWDVASWREMHTLTGLGNTVPMLAFAPDDRTLAAACHDRTVRRWSTATWRELPALRGPGPWQSVAYSHDGRTLAAAVDTFGLIRLWNAADGRVIRDLQGHASGVAGLSFAPDGRTLASASKDRTVKLWHLATGRELRTLRGHEGWVFGLAFAPDGLSLATAGFSDGVRIWEAASFHEVAAAQTAQRAETAPSGAGETPAP
jgi:WD40 repeat protein